MDWGKVAKGLLAISHWPWHVVPLIDEPVIKDADGYVIASMPGLDEDATFIAAAPWLLAEALLERVNLEVMTVALPMEIHLKTLGISPEDYTEIKRRLA